MREYCAKEGAGFPGETNKDTPKGGSGGQKEKCASWASTTGNARHEDLAEGELVALQMQGNDYRLSGGVVGKK